MVRVEEGFPWDGNYAAYSFAEILSEGFEELVMESKEIISIRNHHGLAAVGGIFQRGPFPPHEVWVCFCREFSKGLQQNLRETKQIFEYLKMKYGRLEAHVETNYAQGHRIMRFYGWTPIVQNSFSGRDFIKYEVQ